MKNYIEYIDNTQFENAWPTFQIISYTDLLIKIQGSSNFYSSVFFAPIRITIAKRTFSNLNVIPLLRCYKFNKINIIEYGQNGNQLFNKFLIDNVDDMFLEFIGTKKKADVLFNEYKLYFNSHDLYLEFLLRY